MSRQRHDPFDVFSFLTHRSPKRSILHYRAGQALYSQGGPADSVFYIAKGRVKVTVTSPSGKEAIVAVRGPDEFCGEGALTGKPFRLASAVALTKCELVRLEKETVVRLLRFEPEFADYFLRHLLTRTARVEAALADHLFSSNETRLARALLLLSNFGGDFGPESIPLKVSHETLAKMIGSTRPRVTEFMNKFRNLGLIDYNGNLRVHKALLSFVLNKTRNA
jgi:CRP-like cAMP-binding protein